MNKIYYSPWPNSPSSTGEPRGTSDFYANGNTTSNNIEELIRKEPVNFFLSNILRFCTEEQREVLLESLLERSSKNKRYPTAFHTVDIIPYFKINHYSETKSILLGRKSKDNGLYCTIGGFLDPTDNSAEEAALRELKEETNITITDTSKLIYLGSYKIDDERYKDSKDKIISSLFAIQITREELITAKPGDDISEINFFNEKELTDFSNYKNIVVPKHHIILERFFKYLNLNYV